MEMFRLVVLADLPETTRHERKVAREFRELLFKMGYSLLQQGVYVRLVGDRPNADAQVRKLSRGRPESGTVRVLALTESQYAASTLVAGEEASQEIEVGSQLDIFL